ncbi:hypothetical protein D3C78_1399120 [compost metagenome]
MLILTCKTFITNIKAYHRRLLPLHSVWTVLSSLLFGLITATSVSILMVINGVVYSDSLTLLLREIEINSINYVDTIVIFLTGIWLSIFTMVSIFLACTIGSSFRIRKNAGTWIGILSFFVVQYTVGWVETKLFGDSMNKEPISIVGIEGTANMSSGGVSTEITMDVFSFPWGTFIFELGISALMVWVITYLISRRVEV